jgi:tetratricopeptide (TPR) repeat protein
MKNLKYYLLVVGAAWLCIGCSESSESNQLQEKTLATAEKPSDVVTDPLLFEIKTMEARTQKDSVLDRAAGLRLLRAYQDYYNKHPQDTLALNYLFEAGRVADALGKYDKAVELLANYHDGSANVQRRAEAAYLVAFIYDAHMHMSSKAVKQYNKVIELYPQSPWAQQARQSLPLVGKTDEELLQFIREKNPS